MSVFKNVVEEVQTRQIEAREAAAAAAERARVEKEQRVQHVRARFAEIGVYSFMREQAEQMTQLGFWNKFRENAVDDRASASIEFVPKAGEQPRDSHPNRNVNVRQIVVSCMGDTVECLTGTQNQRAELSQLNADMVAKWFEAFARRALEDRSKEDNDEAASTEHRGASLRSRP